MSKHFTQLHVHTEYSLLDGAMTLPNLINQAKEQGMQSLAITDHGNIFGAVNPGIAMLPDSSRKEGYFSSIL